MSVLSYLQNIVTAADAVTAQTLGDDGLKVVNDAVAAAQALDGAGTDKFSAAVAQAGTDLVALGKDIPLYLLHLAIESAASKLNALVPDATV